MIQIDIDADLDMVDDDDRNLARLPADSADITVGASLLPADRDSGPGS